MSRTLSTAAPPLARAPKPGSRFRLNEAWALLPRLHVRRSSSRVGKQPSVPVWWVEQVHMAPPQALTSTAAIYNVSTAATVAKENSEAPRKSELSSSGSCG